MRCRTWRGATHSRSAFPFCIAPSSGSARSPGGSTGISRTWQSKPATKRLCPSARTGTTYARTLLGFFEALHAAPGRVWWQGVSMAKAGQAEQRLERILAWRGAVTMSLKKSGLKKSFARRHHRTRDSGCLSGSIRSSGERPAERAKRRNQRTPSAEPEVVAPAEESTDVEEVTDQTDARIPRWLPSRLCSLPRPWQESTVSVRWRRWLR